MESAYRRQSRLLAILEPVTSFLPIFGVAVVLTLSFVFLEADSDQILPGLVTFIIALQRLNVRAGSIANGWNSFAENSGRLALTDKILESSGKTFRRTGGIPFFQFARDIRFDGVYFQYKDTQSTVISDLNFQIQHGQTLALVGPSGAGKLLICS